MKYRDRVRFAVRFLSVAFPGAFQLVEGNTLLTLPDFILSGAFEFRCDVSLIDGGHGGLVPAADMAHLWALRPVDRHGVLIADDCHSPTFPAVTDAFNLAAVPWVNWTLLFHIAMHVLRRHSYFVSYTS